ncbi:MAG: hypothetical protein J0H43_03965, partial [Actinobacteria bacterium]|nr:hypothetical protein [Actinomycetota bacterium]
QGVHGMLDYEHYPTYETLGANELNAQYPARAISEACTTASQAVTQGATLNGWSCPNGTQTAIWNGVSSNDSVCDALWYDSSAFDSNGGLGRYSQRLTSGISPTAAYDFTESGSANGVGVTRYVPCQIAFTTGMTFDGKVYTVDAPLISDGVAGGSGPTFRAPFSTAWSATSNPNASPLAYRTDPNVGGTVNANAPVSASNPLTMSSSFNPAVPANACIFYGPTRVKFVSGTTTATVTSPQTSGHSGKSTDSTCYSTVNSAGQYTVNYATSGGGIIYVKNNNAPSNGFTTTGQKSTSSPASATASTPGDTVFYSSVSGGTSNPNYSPAAVAANTCSSPSSLYSSAANASCAWSNLATATDGGSTLGWTTLSSKSCSTLLSGTANAASTDEQNFNCEMNSNQASGNPPSGEYSIIIGRIQSDLTTNSYSISGNGSCSSASFAPASASAAQLGCLIQQELHNGNTGAKQANYSNPTLGDHQYVVNQVGSSVVTTKSANLGSAPTSPLGSDPLFTTAGTPAQETTTSTTSTFTVSRQTYNCSLLNLLGICVGTTSWGSSTPQFTVTVTQNTYSYSAGQALSYFPSMNDVTQYRVGTNSSNGPGDAYVEGSYSGNVALLSDDGVVVTGATTRASASSNLLIDTLGDVNVYNPTQCLDQTSADINATQAGFCPNDLTGLYTGGLTSSGALLSAHPAMQYTTMTGTDGKTDGVSEVDAAIVAQGSATGSDGSLLTENYNRGSSLGTLTIKGGLYQKHRGALGEQWEQQSTSTVQPAFTAYKLAMTYVNMQTVGLPYVPAFTGSTPTRYWNIVSCASPSGGTT